MDVEDDSEDFMFIKALNDVCPKAEKKIEKKKVKMVEVLDAKAEILGNFLKDKGVSSKDFYDTKTWTSENLFDFFDQLHSYYYETSELFKSMSEDEYKKLEIFEGMYRNANHYADWSLTRIFTSRIAENLLEELSNKVIDDDIDLEFSLFSANQEAMMAFISTMRLTSFDCLLDRFNKDYESIYCLDPPEFGSTLVFELNQADSKNKDSTGSTAEDNEDIPIDDEYYVRVVYNGRPLVFCQNDYNFDTFYCPFTKFLETAQNTFIFPDFEDLCGNEELSATKVHELEIKQYEEESVSFYLIWVNVIMFFITGIVIVHVKKSTKQGVENIVRSYKELMKQEQVKKAKQTVNLESMDTEGSQDTDRDTPFNAPELDGDMTFDEEEEKENNVITAD
jgi:hypothetical protein